jgi:hypothetical protein
LESPELSHGVFTYFLVKGLQGEANPKNPGTVSFSQLGSFVKERVRDFSKGQQYPTMFEGAMEKNDPIVIGRPCNYQRPLLSQLVIHDTVIRHLIFILHLTMPSILVKFIEKKQRRGTSCWMQQNR